MLEDNKKISSFSMRKIPIVQKDEDINVLKDDSFEKIKILELCNSIDKWEKEILFSDNGFFSIKGKDVKNKLVDFELELDKFISVKISELKFDNEKFKEIALKIKSEKISAIKTEMRRYEQLQLEQWESDVCDEAISTSINRAVLYKDNQEIVATSFNNGLAILRLMSERENWSRKINMHKESEYKSNFYSELIHSFINDKDIRAYSYFQKYKDNLIPEEKNKLEKIIYELKKNIIAYNWAKEVYSYNLSGKEMESKIKEIEDSDIVSKINNLLLDFSSAEKKLNIEREKEKNQNNWNDLIEILNDDFDRAYLCIDYSLTPESINSKKKYIKQIIKNGYITTDKKQFMGLFKEMIENIESFKTKDISDYRACLSREDYDFFERLQKLSFSEFEKINFEYKYFVEKMNILHLKKEEEKYQIFKLFIFSLDEYKKNNKKEADVKARNEIIELIFARFKENKK